MNNSVRINEPRHSLRTNNFFIHSLIIIIIMHNYYKRPYVHPIQNWKTNLFRLWLILVVLVVLIYIIITICERPLSKNDLTKYMTPIKSFDRSNIPTDYIPVLTDFIEDDHNLDCR